MDARIKKLIKRFNDNQTFEGAGDVIEKVTKTIGIPTCGGCKKRRDYLNKKFPFRKIDDPRTDDDREDIRQS
jgi:hypothetical protein